MKFVPGSDDIRSLAEQSNGILKTADLHASGYSNYDIRKLLNAGSIERIKPGYYRLLSSSADMSEAAQIAQLFPDGVLCMNTALFYYRYSDRTPLEWDIAIDRDTSKSRFKLDYPFVHPVYMKPEYSTITSYFCLPHKQRMIGQLCPIQRQTLIRLNHFSDYTILDKSKQATVLLFICDNPHGKNFTNTLL